MRRRNHHLNDEIKAKIVALRDFSTLTFEQIARECGCGVSKKWK